MKGRLVAGRGVALLLGLMVTAAVPAVEAVPKTFTIEFYYKIRLGYFDEWMTLYQRSHWPIMLAEIQAGYIQKIEIVRPQSSWPEPNRWDLRVSITYRDVLVAHGVTSTGREATVRRLFPDIEAHERDEQRRFQLLDGQWDVELDPVDTSGWTEIPRPTPPP